MDNNWPEKLNKDRASGVIIKNGKILVIHRIKENKEYYVLPGGSVEEGETIEQALDREMDEEFTIKVKQKEFLFKIEVAGRFAYIFNIKEYTGEPKLGGPELQRMNDKNQYIIEEIDLNDLSRLNFYPKEAIKNIQEYAGTT